MASMLRRVAPLVLLIAAIGLSQPTSGANASGTRAKEHVTCPPTTDNQRYDDPRDSCATRANELGEQEYPPPGKRSSNNAQTSGPGVQTTCTQYAQNPEVDTSIDPQSGELDGLSLSVEFPSAHEPTANPPCDVIASVKPDGTVLVQYYPFNSLTLNFPGDEDYQTTLPTGILVNGSPPGGRPNHAPRQEEGEGPGIQLSTSGLSVLGTRVLVAGSHPDSIDDPNHAYMVASLKTYRYTNPDSDPNWNYRVVYSTGSAHGGNSTHHITWAEHRNALKNMPSGYLPTEWEPTSTEELGSGSERLTVTLSVTAPGVSGSASHTFTIYPALYGPFEVKPNINLFAHGWRGDKVCGGTPCQWIGAGGGSEFKYAQGGSYTLYKQIRICWRGAFSHCK